MEFTQKELVMLRLSVDQRAVLLSKMAAASTNQGHGSHVTELNKLRALSIRLDKAIAANVWSDEEPEFSLEQSRLDR